MTLGTSIERAHLTRQIVQLRVPTPTLPPAVETNTYLIYDGSVGVLVDAGTQDERLLEELKTVVRDTGVSQVTALIATHYHRDHVQGLPFLHRAYNAPIYVHSLDIAPACKEMGLRHAEIASMPRTLQVGSIAMEIDHAPGHTHGHVHIRIPHEHVILVGDHLAGDGSVWIGPPDGHMADYYRALESIANSGCHIAGPGHGRALDDAKTAAESMLERRQAREEEIYRRLTVQPLSVEELVQSLYGAVIPKEAMWVARRTVKAHLEHLIDLARVNRVYQPTCQCFRYVPR